jgi:hypothetical protein
MDTILNLGLNDQICEQMIKSTNNPRFVYDIQRRFLAMFGEVVLGVTRGTYDNIMNDVKSKRGLKSDQELSLSELQQIVSLFKGVATVPNDVNEQLKLAIGEIPQLLSHITINNHYLKLLLMITLSYSFDDQRPYLALGTPREQSHTERLTTSSIHWGQQL